MDVGVAILSGGENKRFQQIGSIRKNKALEVVDNKRMIEWVIEVAYQVSNSVTVVAREKEQEKLYSNLFSEKYPNLHVIADMEGVGHSPLIGLATSARFIKKDRILVLPCDTPYIKIDVLKMLIEKAIHFDVVTPLWPDGKIEPLISVYKREHIQLCYPALLNLKRWRPSDFLRGSIKSYMINVENIKIFDPELISFYNINYLQDIDKLTSQLHDGYIKDDKILCPNKADIKLMKEVIKSISDKDKKLELINSLVNSPFWFALFSMTFQELDEKWSIAAKNFETEANYFIKEEVKMLALHSLLDALLCWKRVGSAENIKRVATQVEELKSDLNIDFEGRLKVLKKIEIPSKDFITKRE